MLSIREESSRLVGAANRKAKDVSGWIRKTAKLPHAPDVRLDVRPPHAVASSISVSLRGGRPKPPVTGHCDRRAGGDWQATGGRLSNGSRSTTHPAAVGGLLWASARQAELPQPSAARPRHTYPPPPQSGRGGDRPTRQADLPETNGPTGGQSDRRKDGRRDMQTGGQRHRQTGMGDRRTDG